MTPLQKWSSHTHSLQAQQVQTVRHQHGHEQILEVDDDSQYQRHKSEIVLVAPTSSERPIIPASVSMWM